MNSTLGRACLAAASILWFGLATARAQTPTASPAPIGDQPAQLHALALKAGKLVEETLTPLATRDSDKDTEFYQDGYWHSKDEADIRSQMGAGYTCGVLWKWLGNPASGTPDTPETKQKREWLHRLAVETIDRQIKEGLKPSGEFTPGGPTTHFVAISLGGAFDVLKDSLDAPTRERWHEAFIRMVEYLIKTNDLPTPGSPGWKGTDGWYANGNIELGESEMVYLAWKATGEQRYKDLFELQWNHTLKPDPNRWGKNGYGLFYIKEPTKADGADGAGYLAEAEQDPGFDRDYTHYSLTVASRLYVESGDPRVLRLCNLLLNSLLPYVNKDTWMLDATYGSRHSTHFHMFTCGLAVAALLGDRPDLLGSVDDQFEKGITQVIAHEYAKRVFSSDACVILQAAMLKK